MVTRRSPTSSRTSRSSRGKAFVNAASTSPVTTSNRSPERFIARHAELDGCRVDYLLHDQPVRFLRGKLRLRQVTHLCDDGHQTQIITGRCDLRDVEVAYRMFERWRQENFFKYMREEFLLDALVDYQIEP